MITSPPRRRLNHHFSFLAAAFLALAGCHKEVPPPAVLKAEQIPDAMEAAFSKANADSKTIATDVAGAIKSQDPDRALTGLQTLSAQPGLTPEQAAAAAQALVSYNQSLQDAAARGDEKSAAALAHYKATK